jgi:hypothetical protein
MARLDLNQRAPQTRDSQIRLQRRQRRCCLIDRGKHSCISRPGPERIERSN